MIFMVLFFSVFAFAHEGIYENATCSIFSQCEKEIIETEKLFNTLFNEKGIVELKERFDYIHNLPICELGFFLLACNVAIVTFGIIVTPIIHEIEHYFHYFRSSTVNGVLPFLRYFLSMFAFRTFSNSATCSICFEPIFLDEKSILLSCDHLFHASCISNWVYSIYNLPSQKNCPLCRKSILICDYLKLLIFDRVFQQRIRAGQFNLEMQQLQ